MGRGKKLGSSRFCWRAKVEVQACCSFTFPIPSNPCFRDEQHTTSVSRQAHHAILRRWHDSHWLVSTDGQGLAAATLRTRFLVSLWSWSWRMGSIGNLCHDLDLPLGSHPILGYWRYLNTLGPSLRKAFKPQPPRCATVISKLGRMTNNLTRFCVNQDA